jgi:cell pole-organizing protein PopZ
MEEILASIRRIIADDDALPLMRRPSLVAREAAPAPERHADVTPERPVSRHPPAPAPTAPAVHLVPVPLAEPGSGNPEEAARERETPAGQPELSAPTEREEYASYDAQAIEEHPETAPIETPVSPSGSGLQAEERENTPLVSPSTDASVASSFQSLATSMFLRDSDMIARTARDMLRPMLKQWLDDNLPVMVERLVRAEIERVARGGR